ncbi:MAG: hypothetical protein GC138_06420 [Gammaproteobacteria bacterium]|nr:hypothetical protein [Gammaproteobacteria bacterium]
MRRILFTLIFTLAAFAFSTPLFACEAAGANTHVGNIVSVNPKTRTLTIMDMATQAPIQFALNDALMIKVNGLSGQVVVRYSGEEQGKLIATQILQ